jgi:hypothetical protein
MVKRCGHAKGTNRKTKTAKKGVFIVAAMTALSILTGALLAKATHSTAPVTAPSVETTATREIYVPQKTVSVSECNCAAGGNCALEIEGIKVEFSTSKDYAQAKAKLNAIRPVASYKGKEIPAELNRAAMVAGVLTPFPYRYWIKEMYLESTLGENVKNKASGACGAFHILPSTMLENLYYIEKSGKYPHLREAGHIERIVTKDRKYTFAVKRNSGLTEAAIVKKICADPVKSVLVSAENKMRYMPSLMEVFAPDQVPDTAIYTLHVFGGAGANSFYSGIKDSPNYPAIDMYKKSRNAVKQSNANIFFHDRKTKNPRSFMDVWKYFHAKFQTELVQLGAEIPAVRIVVTRDATPLPQQTAFLDQRFN